MIRIAIELILLFFIPTVAYLGYALLTQPGGPAGKIVAGAPLALLGLCGAALVLGTLVYYGLTNDTTKGGDDETYTPAHINKDGQIDPAHYNK